jgi:hypothetical protein
MSSSVVARPFIALSGDEIKKAILNEIQRQLDADYRFKQHLTYPMVSWRWELAMKLYPTDGPDVHVVLDKTIKAPGAVPPFSGITKDFVLSGERIVAAPSAGETADQVRRDSNLPVPQPRTVAGPAGSKVTIDAPEIPTGTQSAPAAEQREGGAARVISQSKETARSVTVRTRAHPTGHMPTPVPGTPPDETRAAEIANREAKEPPEGGNES